MLTKDEKLFIQYWENNREKKRHLSSMLVSGLPMGLIFALPVLLAVIFHDWYKSMIYISDAQLIVIMIGVLAIAVFYGVFRMKFRWQQNEQLYKELKLRDSADDAAH
jgi:hypothetical protein